METKLATYNHDGLKLDLYGFLYNSGFEVTDAVVVGTRVSVKADKDLLMSMTAWCDDVLVPDWSMMTSDDY